MVDTVARAADDIDPGLTRLSRRARTWLLTVASLDVLMVITSMVALNAALPDIALDTNATQGELTWVVDGYTLVLACLLLPAGAIGDRYGRRGTLLCGLAIFGVASISPVFFDSPLHIIIARAVAGMGAALIMPATLSLLTAAFPKSERNKAVGIWAGVCGSGAVIGFLGSGVLLHFFSWQSIFWAFTAASVAMFVLTCTIASSRDEALTPVDWIGAVLIGGAVAVFVFGVVEAPIRGWTHPVVWGAIAGGAALAVAFAITQLRHDHPLLDVRLFSRPDFATGAVGITFLFLANFGFFYVEMQYLQLVLGYTPLQTAFALAPLALPILAFSATMHLYLPRMGLRITVALGLALIGAGLLATCTLDADAAYIDLAWPLLITAAGIGLCTAPTTTAIMHAVPDEKQGVASAVNDATREIGAALGIAIAGSILAAQFNNQLEPALAAFPEQIRGSALDSLAHALAVAEHMGPQGAQLAAVANEAFVHAMHNSLVVLSVSLFVAAAFIAVWAPGRDGRQLQFVRRLIARRSRHDQLGGVVSEHDDGGVRTPAGDGRQDGAVDHP
ncbi:MFS transporter [Mycolicibacterium sp. 120270]|uniref:MFS transporter n=1 Tax=Mycolicibacterium sp. 120270 TaxID=3090600 RepID=UPI00299E3727|nr:MFS transporter [Mycolicibacterium sp. 120270]MDX1884612.1 MFS transporter [Mycolicibacterium sp. 120270]